MYCMTMFTWPRSTIWNCTSVLSYSSLNLHILVLQWVTWVWVWAQGVTKSTTRQCWYNMLVKYGIKLWLCRCGKRINFIVPGQYEIKILLRTTLNDGIDMKKMILLMITKITERNLEEAAGIGYPPGWDKQRSRHCLGNYISYAREIMAGSPCGEIRPKIPLRKSRWLNSYNSVRQILVEAIEGNLRWRAIV